MVTVSKIMTPVVHTIGHDKLVSEVEGILVAENISGAPLINDDDNIVGLISKSDIVHFDFIGGDTFNTPAIEIATSNIITINADESVQAAARKIIAEDVHRLLVVEDGKMAGLLSATDIVKYVAENELSD